MTPELLPPQWFSALFAIVLVLARDNAIAARSIVQSRTFLSAWRNRDARANLPFWKVAAILPLRRVLRQNECSADCGDSSHELFLNRGKVWCSWPGEIEIPRLIHE